MTRKKAPEGFVAVELVNLGDDIEVAHSFLLSFCENPRCGVHLIPMRNVKNARGRSVKQPICEVALSLNQTRALIQFCQDHLYEQAVEKDILQ